MENQELGKESEGAMQGLEAWACAARERGLCGFRGPHWASKGESRREVASM